MKTHKLDAGSPVHFSPPRTSAVVANAVRVRPPSDGFQPMAPRPVTLDASTPPDPNTWLGLKKGDVQTGKADTRIKDLQSQLVQLGYLPAGTRPTGSFGFATEEALRHLQREYGLPQTGQVDAATLAVLKAPGTKVWPELRGVAEQNSPELGTPTGAPRVTLDPATHHLMITQVFQHGSVVLDRTANRAQAYDSSGKPIGNEAQVGTFSNTADANAHFLNQEGNTDFFASSPDTRTPDGAEDCGPTTAAMALSALGLIPHPDAASAADAIARLRMEDQGTDAPDKTKGSGFADLSRAMGAYNAQTKRLDSAKLMGKPPDFSQVDVALALGHPVMLGGVPGNAWAQSEINKTPSNYLDPGKNNKAMFAHFVAVLGKTPDGYYILADPLVKSGTLTVTPQQLSQFMNDGVSKGFYGAMEVMPNDGEPLTPGA